MTPRNEQAQDRQVDTQPPAQVGEQAQPAAAHEFLRQAAETVRRVVEGEGR